MRAILPFLFLGCTTASGESRVDQKSLTDEAPIVLELFTSQGCSSCPSADALLDKLAQTGSLGGRPLAPIAFHVDYWDELGWADPYASPAWTARQQAYASSLGDHVYTPQLVVAGTTGLVGSNALRAAQAIADAPKQQKIAANAMWNKTSVIVEATAPANADVFVAIYQNGTKTKVPRGENAGETLAADRVVRRFERVARAGGAGRVEISIEPGWSGAVAFAQRADRKIVGSALLSR